VITAWSRFLLGPRIERSEVDVIITVSKLRSIAAWCAGLGSVALVAELGIGPAVGTLLGGALIASWAFVYAHAICAGERVKLREMGWTAVLGAGCAPVVVLLSAGFGAAVALPLMLLAAWWIGAVTPTGHLPGAVHRAASGLTRPSGSKHRPD
jgi:hypothetical protein